MSKKQKTHFLVLKQMTLEIGGKKIKNIHGKGEVFLSYYNFEDALRASENGKYQIFELAQSTKKD